MTSACGFYNDTAIGLAVKRDAVDKVWSGSAVYYIFLFPRFFVALRLKHFLIIFFFPSTAFNYSPSLLSLNSLHFCHFPMPLCDHLARINISKDVNRS